MSLETVTKPSITHRFWEEVNPFTESEDGLVIPDGETWTIESFAGGAAFLDNTEVRLVWDHGGTAEQILSITHGDLSTNLSVQLTGDGVKLISIVLINDTDTTRGLGGQFTYTPTA